MGKPQIGQVRRKTTETDSDPKWASMRRVMNVRQLNAIVVTSDAEPSFTFDNAG